VNGDGSDALDFTYIGDLVQGLTLCMTRPEARNQIFNLTYGDARTLKQMVEIVRAELPDVGVKFKHATS